MLFKSFSKTLFFFVWLFFNFKCYFFNHFIYMLNYNESMVIETLVVCTSQNNYCFWIEILIKKMILQKTLKNCFLYYTIFFSFKANIYYFKIDLFKITNLIFLGLGGGGGGRLFKIKLATYPNVSTRTDASFILTAKMFPAGVVYNKFQAILSVDSLFFYSPEGILSQLIPFFY